MNENNNKTAGYKDKRRYKYGSVSIAFTVVFIALVLVVNLVLSSLSLSGDLTVDLTQEAFTTVGEESIRLLSDLGKDLDITIYFMSPRDMFDLEANNFNGVNLTGICRDLAENYANVFDGSGDKGIVRVEYKELDKDPEFEKKYLEESGTTLTSTSIIVQGKYHYRVISMPSFFTVDEQGNYSSFNGEYRLTTAILRASIAEQQVVTLTYGHGEPLNSDGTIPAESKLASVSSVLADAGFEVKTADISSQEIDPRTKILICCDPVTDFSYNEIDKVTEYLSDRNSFVVLVDSATPALPNLQSCLNDNWGINYKPNYRITDNTHSFGDYANINAMYPVIEAGSESGSAAYQIRKTVTDSEGTINTILPESVELEIKPNITKDGFVVETVLSTYETASSENNGSVGTKGNMPLMLVSTKHGYGENNVNQYSYVMLVGSTEFVGNENLSQSYGNRRVLLAAARIFGADNVAPDILPKEFGSTALDIESGTARTLTWVICTVLPGIILIMGFVVFFKRRHL